MSRIVVIEKNKNGKIELTKEELQTMLDDAYNQGYADGLRRPNTITLPSNTEPYTYGNWEITCTGDKVPTIIYDSVSGLPKLKEDT